MNNGTINNIVRDSNSLNRYLNITINLFYLIFGNIGNLLKIAFFLQKPLLSLPCAIYIRLATISDFVTINNLPVRQLLIHLYPEHHWIKINGDWSNQRNESILLTYSVSTYDIVICKCRTYLHMLSIDLSSLMLVFASINRFCFSYMRKKCRKNSYHLGKIFCHLPNVRRLCSIAFLVCAVLSVQHIFNFTVVSPSQGCIPRYNIIWTVWILSVHSFLAPILMIIFGILTLKNLGHLSVFRYCLHRRRRHHYHSKRNQFNQMCSQCIRHQNSMQHQTDNQLTSMIICEIIVTVLTSLPYGIYAFYHLLYEIQERTIYNSSKTEWILLFIRMCMYFEASCGFYIYMMTLTTLRKRFFKTLVEKLTTICFCFCYK
jgi:hypothetical protein